MSRHDERRDVTCSDCGRVLRATAAYANSGWHLPRHKRPDGSGCWGSRSTKHEPTETEQS